MCQQCTLFKDDLHLLLSSQTFRSVKRDVGTAFHVLETACNWTGRATMD